mgnify:CR=1 FL=1
MSNEIADIRKDYKLASLEEADVAANPIDQFTRWWNEAVASQIDEVNAMTLATVNATGVPAARIVLLKGYTDDGFVFFTNYTSAKSKEIDANKNAALLFFWKELERQIRIEGVLEKVSEENSNEYFKTRPRESQIGAWASPQSTTITRAELEKRVEEFTKKFEGQEVPRPEHWGGFRLIPARFEFWQGRAGRLHDRFVYENKNGVWEIGQIAP